MIAFLLMVFLFFLPVHSFFIHFNFAFPHFKYFIDSKKLKKELHFRNSFYLIYALFSFNSRYNSASVCKIYGNTNQPITGIAAKTYHKMNDKSKTKILAF